MSAARIGITWSPRRGLGYYASYLHAVAAAGGEVVTFEATPGGPTPERARAMLDDVDGLLVPGGWDVDPPRYGEPRAVEIPEVDAPLDLTEIALIRAAVDQHVPILGICRGQQVINVALGGTLHQHVDGHDMHGRPRDLLAHPVDVVAGSELSRIAPGEILMVNSLHHQAVKDVAPGLQVTARGPDGIIEGVESSDGMIVAVQCHPEELVDQQRWAMSFFRRFVDRVGERARDAAAAGSATGT
jgi:putative glutamine amidotransferase